LTIRFGVLEFEGSRRQTTESESIDLGQGQLKADALDMEARM